MPSRPALTLNTITPSMANWDSPLNANLVAISNLVTVYPIPLAVTTVAGLSGFTASLYQNCVCMVSDPASGKTPLVYSNGTVWKYVMDGTNV